MTYSDLAQLLPDESASGFLLRRAIASGSDLGALRSGLIRLFPDFRRSMVGLRVVPRITTKNAVSLQRFKFGLGDDIGRLHTVAPLFEPLMGPDVSLAMGRLYEERRCEPAYYMTASLWPVQSRPTYSRLQYCPACFRAQVREFGTAYLRREWNIPYLRHCPQHKIALCGIGCPECQEGDVLWRIGHLFQQVCPTCSSDQWRGNETRSEPFPLAVSQWFSDMLRQPVPHLTQEGIDSCIEITVERLGNESVYMCKDHRCTDLCEEVACVERCHWMASQSGRLLPDTVRHLMEIRISRQGTSPFLLFWLPIICAFGELSRFTAALGETLAGSHHANSCSRDCETTQMVR